MPLPPKARTLLVPNVTSLTLTALVLHSLTGLAWWWLMPHGFGVSHPRFWLNTVMPLSVAKVTLTIAAVLWRNARHRTRNASTGTLRRGEPVTLTFADEGGPVAAWTIEGFGEQANVEPSPTAGWGMPQNAIRFDADGGGVLVYVTLAGTGVGWGFDTVVHAAGRYGARYGWRWLKETP